MWPYGRDLVPYPAAFPQNFRVQNPGRSPDMQNQQEIIYTTSAPYPPYVPYSQQAFPAPYLQQALPAPYSQQAFPAPYLQQAVPEIYSQQVSGVGWPTQDPMTGDIVQQDQIWPLQNRNRRESMPEYNIGEMVMVRCSQQKWLQGVIQRMSVQGLRVWLADAHILVNVPLMLVPTHVLKVSTFSELQALPQPQGEHMWTMTITDNSGCRKALMQCVRPAHLSHRQLFQKFGGIECAICKTTVSSIEVVSPWNCSHRAHNYCLQLRMQHSSTIGCPSCNEIDTRQLWPIPHTGNSSTLHHMPSTSTGIGSTSNFRRALFTSNAPPSQSNGQYQCACGFRGSIAGVSKTNAPVFCPNCHKPVNINSTTLGMQSGEPFAPRSLPRAYTEVDTETLQRKTEQNQGFGWLMQSFSGPGRLEAIEESSREGISSTPPSPDYTSLELFGTDEDREESSFSPSYILSFGETFKNNISNPDFFAEVADQNMQLSSSSPSSWQDGSLYEPSAQITLSQNEESRDNAPDSMEVLIGPSASLQVNHVQLARVEEPNEPSEKLETEPTTIAALDRQKSWRRASEVDRTRRIFDSEESEKASSSTNFATTRPSTPTVYVNHFANFVNLAVAGASTAKERAKEILASASASQSSLTTDPPLKSPTTAWVTPAPAIITPSPAFFSRATGLVTEPPAWVTMANGGDASPAWITVIKDGVGSRKDDKQCELQRMGKQKEAEFL